MPKSDEGLVVDHAEDVVETEDALSNEVRSDASEERPIALDAALPPTSSPIRNP